MGNDILPTFMGADQYFQSGLQTLGLSSGGNRFWVAPKPEELNRAGALDLFSRQLAKEGGGDPSQYVNAADAYLTSIGYPAVDPAAHAAYLTGTGQAEVLSANGQVQLNYASASAPPMPHPDAGNQAAGPNIGGEEGVTRPSDVPQPAVSGGMSLGPVLLIGGGLVLLLVLMGRGKK